MKKISKILENMQATISESTPLAINSCKTIFDIKKLARKSLRSDKNKILWCMI